MYFQDEIDYERFAKFPTGLIRDGVWRAMPKSAQAVFPVYLMHMNDKGLSFPDERTVAALAGVTCKTAREGRNAIAKLPGVKMQRYVTARGRRSWRLTFPIPDGRGTWKGFGGAVLFGGNWAECRPTAKALFPVLLNYAFFSPDAGDTAGVEYAERDFDLCEAEIPVLARFAGLSRNGVASGIESLRACHLITFDDDFDCWRIFRTPPKRFTAEYMNRHTIG